MELEEREIEREKKRQEGWIGGEWSPLPLLLCSPQGGQTEIWDGGRQWGTDKWVSQRYHEQPYTNEAYLLQAGGEERRGEERKGKERKGKERKGKEKGTKTHNIQTYTDPVAYMTWRWMCNCSVFNPAMCLLSRHICITVPSTHAQHTHKHTHTRPLSSSVCYCVSILSSQLWTWKKLKQNHKSTHTRTHTHTHTHTHKPVRWKVAPYIHRWPVNHMLYTSVTLT